MAKRSHAIHALVTVTATLALGLLTVELLVRWLNLAPPLPSESDYVIDPYVGYKPRPMSVIAGRSDTDEYGYEYEHNSAGFRDVEHAFEKQKGTFRIVGLGDSFTYGKGAAFNETYLYLLEQMLNEDDAIGSQVEVIKLGIPSYFPELERKMLEHYGKQYGPDLVLVGFLENDIIDTYKGPEAVTATKSGYLMTADARAMGPAALFLYVNVATSRILFRRYFDYGLEQPRWDQIDMDNGYHEADWRKVEAEYGRMLDIANSMGAALVIVHIPQDGPWDERSEYPATRLSQWADQHGAGFVSALPQMKVAARSGQRLYYDKDRHCTPAGYRVVAEAIYGYLSENELVP